MNIVDLFMSMSLNLQNPVNRQQTLVNRFNNSSSFSLQVYQPSWLTSLRARRALRMKNFRSCQNQKPQNPPATCLPARSLSHLANTMGSCVTGPYWTILLVLYYHDSLLYYSILYYYIIYCSNIWLFIIFIHIFSYLQHHILVCSLVAMVDSKSHCRPAPSPDGTQSCSQVASELNRFGGPQMGDFLWLLATRDARVLFEIMKKRQQKWSGRSPENSTASTPYIILHSRYIALCFKHLSSCVAQIANLNHFAVRSGCVYHFFREFGTLSFVKTFCVVRSSGGTCAWQFFSAFGAIGHFDCARCELPVDSRVGI